MMVTAKNFAMMSRFAASGSGLSPIKPSCLLRVAGSAEIAAGVDQFPRYLALNVKSAVRWLPCGHRHLLRLGSVFFLPRSHGVVSGRHVLDRVRPLSSVTAYGPFTTTI